MINYTLLSRPNAFFLCANSGFGFVSHVEEALADCTRLYVLKGGPGTGKSRFMEEIASAAESRGHKVSRILCSSDPSSLDGVHIEDLGIGLVDGTAPHVVEPTLPGAREQLLDPGAFWDQKILFETQKEINSSNLQKKEAYRSALLLIESVKNAEFCKQSLLKDRVDRQKAYRLLKKHLPKTAPVPGKIRPRFLSAIGMKGAVTLDGYFEKAERILTLSPCFGAELLILQHLLNILSEKKQSLLLFKDPVTLQPEALFLEQEGLLFRCGKPTELPQERVVDCKKAIVPLSLPEKRLLQSLEKQQQSLMESAFFFFDEMKKQHFALEELYGKAMDFSALEAFKKEQTERILK